MNIDFPVNPVFGQHYNVPHVFCEYLSGVRNLYVPISSPLHEDGEIIGFPYKHYHIDWRFMPTKIYKRICYDEGRNYDNAEISDQAKLIVELYEGDKGDKRYATNVTHKKEVIYFKRKYIREFLHNKFEEAHPKLYQSWPIKLQAAYCGKELKQNDKGQYVCPHKGAIVDIGYKNSEGHIVCPAHLLKFDNSLTAIKSK